jgi:hypothetical protein
MAVNNTPEDLKPEAGSADVGGVPTDPPSSELPKDPAPWELVKELNAHAGRLATLLGLLLTATSLTIATGPIHDAIGAADISAHGVLYALLIMLGISLLALSRSVIVVLEPPLPIPKDGEYDWSGLIAKKRQESSSAAALAGVTVWALLLVWVTGPVNLFQKQPVLNVGAAIVLLIMAGWIIRSMAHRSND